MGMILEQTPEMGEYGGEVRRESFYLHGEDSFNGKKPHAIECYPNECGQGTVEILIEDIPKVRAVLDRVEQIDRQTNARGRPNQLEIAKGLNIEDLTTRHSEFLAAMRRCITPGVTGDEVQERIAAVQAEYIAWFAEHGITAYVPSITEKKGA